jgi:uncharacterized membrane protein
LLAATTRPRLDSIVAAGRHKRDDPAVNTRDRRDRHRAAGRRYGRVEPASIVTTTIDLVLLAAAVGSGLMAGFFFAFSICVMRALGALPSAQGIAAMQSINVAVLNPWFLSVFFGMAVLSIFLIVAALLRWHEPAAACALAGSLLYLLGTFVVTILFNVPRNRALAGAAATSREGAALWADYVTAWTRWNHVRTIAALAAAGCFTFAIAR